MSILNRVKKIEVSPEITAYKYLLYGNVPSVH